MFLPFRGNSIDYFNLQSSVWIYGWYPPTPASTPQINYLNNGSHEALVGQDNVVYYCNGSSVGAFLELDGQTFDPTNLSTYGYNTNGTSFFNVVSIPGIDTTTCLAELGQNLLIGGIRNQIYPWNRVGTVVGTSINNGYSYPIILAEYNVQKMVTVNTNTYIFVGNRGRIYITNGTNAQLYKKVPDHISGTVEPYFTWGGACSVKNQLYFGALATTNASAPISQYGGVWAIDLDTEAIRLTNQLSYGTYAGHASALIPNFNPNSGGTGLYIGWSDGTTNNFGIDTTVSTPYTGSPGSQATIDSDLIPIGTFTKPRNFEKMEYRLTVPMVSGESITIKSRLIFNVQSSGYTTGITDNTVGNWSNIEDTDFSQAQWVQFQIVLNSTASSPSYVRLKEIRIRGLVGPTLATNELLSL